MNNEVTKIAKNTNGEPVEPPASKSIIRMLEKIGGNIYMYMNEESYELIKDEKPSLVDKVEAELDKVPESLADVARMTIYYENFIKMKNGIKALRENDAIPLVDERNTYATKEPKAKESGYRDVNMKVLIPIKKADTIKENKEVQRLADLIDSASWHRGNAHMFVGEIQLKLKSFADIEHASHKDYEKQRTYIAEIKKLKDKEQSIGLTADDQEKLKWLEGTEDENGEKVGGALGDVETKLKGYKADYEKAYK